MNLKQQQQNFTKISKNYFPITFIAISGSNHLVDTFSVKIAQLVLRCYIRKEIDPSSKKIQNTRIYRL